MSRRLLELRLVGEKVADTGLNSGVDVGVVPVAVVVVTTLGGAAAWSRSPLPDEERASGDDERGAAPAPGGKKAEAGVETTVSGGLLSGLPHRDRDCDRDWDRDCE